MFLGFGHIERLCQRAAVPVVEPSALKVSAIVKTSEEQSELETLRTENAQLKAKVAEILQKSKRCCQHCAICRTRMHHKGYCPKRSGLKDVPCSAKEIPRLVLVNIVCKTTGKGVSDSIVHVLPEWFLVNDQSKLPESVLLWDKVMLFRAQIRKNSLN